MKRTSPLLPENQATTFAETEYYFEKNLRKVKPYFFTHHSFAKKRWIGETPLQVLEKEYTIYGNLIFQPNWKTKTVLDIPMDTLDKEEPMVVPEEFD